jgi:hypothetical protein
VQVTGGTLAFDTVPSVPLIGGVTLDGTAQTTHARMSDWSVVDPTGTAAGWHVTVAGDTGTGKSEQFAEYCLDAVDACSEIGYVSGGAKLAQNSLTLTSTGAAFTGRDGTTGTGPAHSCSTGCNLDATSAAPTTVASAGADAGMGTWQAGSYDPSSVSLAIPTTTKALASNKRYRADLLWSLVSGP